MKQNKNSEPNENTAIKQKPREDSNNKPKLNDKKTNLENSIEKNAQKSENAIINKEVIKEEKALANQENKSKANNNISSPYIRTSKCPKCNCDCDCNCICD